MRRILASLLVVFLAGCGATPRPPSPGPVIIATAPVADRVRDLTIRSPAVGADVGVRLILPAGFGQDPSARYPVLYLLHGSGESASAWTRSTDVEQLVAGSPVLVVMPDGGPVGFYSDWRRGPRWETFHTVELWQLLREQYQASDVRAVAGLSMGGLGALAYAAHRPGTFRAAAAFSGVVHTRFSSGESEAYRNIVREKGADPDDLWGDPVADAGVWAAHNPYDLAAGLKGTKLFLSYGDGSPGPLDRPGAATDVGEFALHDENVALTERLTALGIPFRADAYGSGTHSWPYWERALHRAWPMLEAALTG
jgi:diacylglycerol O-acyltransferase/trehalose O-mycolyltransferase